MKRYTIEELQTMRESEDHVEFKKGEGGNVSYNGKGKDKPNERRRCILGYAAALCNEGGGGNNGEEGGDNSGDRLIFPPTINVDGVEYEVTGITPDALRDLDGVREIIIDLPRIPEMAPDAFDGIDLSGITLYVPEELIDDYRQTEPWNRFPEIVPIHEHVTTPDGSEFIVNHDTNTADMVSGGRTENHPSVIVIPATFEYGGRAYPVTRVEPDVFVDLTGVEEVLSLPVAVPYLAPDALDDQDLSGIVLYVPEELIDEYRNTYPWSLFPDIRPLSESGIETVTVTNSTTNRKYIENGRIVILHNGKKYSVQGARLR